MLKKFNEIFQIKPSNDQGKTEFINRMYTLLNSLAKQYEYGEVFNGVCFELGLNPRTFESRDILGRTMIPTLPSLTNGNFHETLKVTSALYSYFKKTNDWRSYQRMDNEIPALIELSTTNVGLRWVEGFFYPDNIHEIDTVVIDETLSWVTDYPAAKKDLQNALVNYSSGKVEQVLPLCYNALENIIQQKTGLNTPLHKEELRKILFQRIKVSDNWRQFLVKFVEYANDFGRHGRNPERHSIDPDETESFLYFSLIMIRMIIRKLPNEKKGFFRLGK